MTIQWFPGHMTRARRQIEDKLKLIDMVIELVDARLPLSSRNPMIDEILQGKPRMIILNKADLADPAITSLWVEFFKKQGHEVLPLDAASGYGIKEIPERSKMLLKEKRDKRAAKGMNQRPMRGLIVGIPNVGKSTLINRLAGKSIAATGDRPGVTKGQQWIKIGTEMELLDTPGILWPKFEDQTVGYRLAVTGAIREEILNVEDVAYYGMKYICEYYWKNIAERFELSEPPQDLDNPNDIVEIMEEIGRKRGCLMSGGRVDLEKASKVILREFRAGKLGRISMETP
ncbi:ribosome biogenesis GTPase YlqF [Paenibacillus shenyangensis]|uniref:ribosome biogenesis GTPase YlqF n=1 Tax=Paenibacillus sp. A9 TaxID=1284352 RepID=UPI00036C6B64|nr:ribosome biogenesis GTPase YlqF [Paenibacillus sp. A9]